MRKSLFVLTLAILIIAISSSALAADVVKLGIAEPMTGAMAVGGGAGLVRCSIGVGAARIGHSPGTRLRAAERVAGKLRRGDFFGFDGKYFFENVGGRPVHSFLNSSSDSPACFRILRRVPEGISPGCMAT